MKRYLWMTMILLACSVGYSRADSEGGADVPMIVFTMAPTNTTVSYVNAADELVQGEPLVLNRQYPATVRVTLGAPGQVRVQVVGNPTPLIVRGDRRATFNFAGSTPLDGIVVNVPAGGSNVIVVSGGRPRIISAGSSSSGRRPDGTVRRGRGSAGGHAPARGGSSGSRLPGSDYR